jgi:RNA recognition motif-containing protein
MRDKNTNRGRGFGFVKMSFKDEEEALKAKEQIIQQNQYPGHIILDKKVDVKSADDYHDKKTIGGAGLPPGMMGAFPGMPGAAGFNPAMAGVAPVSKPNPYAIAETKVKGDNALEVSFKYPRSKIFVGGLDFKLTQDELKYHFQQYGEVVDACILKDIYTGQSRGFGFVTFKDEDTA